MMLQRRDVETSRCGDVAMLRRRDVETSRRGSHFLALIPIAPNLLPTAALFAPIYLHSNQKPNRGSNHKNYIINIKKNVETIDRREYSMSVLGTHHTPKLSFLLDLKQELTLDNLESQFGRCCTCRKIGDQFELTRTATVLLEVHQIHTAILLLENSVEMNESD